MSNIIVAELGMYEHEEDFMDAQSLMIEAIENSTKFPVLLTAENSNWRGQTGTAEADSGAEVLDKLYSFDPGEGFTFKHDDEDGYYFRLSSHDRPTGFNVYIEELKDDS